MPQPETMIDKMAAAVWARHDESSVRMGARPRAWPDDLPGWQRENYRDSMRAALAAAREPTEAVLQRATGASVNGDVWNEDYPIIWRAIIDAILAEHPNDRPADAA